MGGAASGHGNAVAGDEADRDSRGIRVVWEAREVGEDSTSTMVRSGLQERD
jgi:hypothetical protein